jgi:hypothetical protein
VGRVGLEPTTQGLKELCNTHTRRRSRCHVTVCSGYFSTSRHKAYGAQAVARAHGVAHRDSAFRASPSRFPRTIGPPSRAASGVKSMHCYESTVAVDRTVGAEGSPGRWGFEVWCFRRAGLCVVFGVRSVVRDTVFGYFRQDAGESRVVLVVVQDGQIVMDGGGRDE